MLTPGKADPGSLSSRMRTESHVLTLYADCYIFLTSNTGQRNRASSFQAFSCKHLQIIWALLSHFYTEIKVRPETGKSENLL